MAHNGLLEGGLRLLARRLATALVFLTGALGLGGCVTINGGAIDFSWIVYCASGPRPSSATCSCSARAAALSRVRLTVVGLADGAATDLCVGNAGCDVAASGQSGTTGFFIPPGDYAISLVPLDANGTPLGGPDCTPGVPDGGQGDCWETPAPLRETIVLGQTIQLNALIIVVPDCPFTCSPNPACTP
jgi:hypothetical protein